jgi:hypothetical protein
MKTFSSETAVTRPSMKKTSWDSKHRTKKRKSALPFVITQEGDDLEDTQVDDEL